MRDCHTILYQLLFIYFIPCICFSANNRENTTKTHTTKKQQTNFVFHSVAKRNCTQRRHFKTQTYFHISCILHSLINHITLYVYISRIHILCRAKSQLSLHLLSLKNNTTALNIPFYIHTHIYKHKQNT